MSDPNLKKQLPGFLIENLSEDKPLSESEKTVLENIWSASSNFKYDAADTDAQWQKFKAQIEQPESTKGRKQFAMFRWAAAAVVLIVAGIGISQYIGGEDKGFTAIYHTGNDIQKVHLPDGSDIILNAQTELIVNTMNASKRELVLKYGEAFFKVSHNNTPFSVKTIKGTITVLGTEFNINAYPKSLFSVFLKTGKIDMKFSGKTVTLQPGQCLQENAMHQMQLMQLTDNRNYAWLDNKLVFDSTSLSEVISVLESTYKVKFVYDLQMKDEKINITIENLNAEQVAELLSKTLNSKVRVE